MRYQLAYRASDRTVKVLAYGTALPEGFIDAGNYYHSGGGEDLHDSNSENHVTYHHVQGAMYVLGEQSMQVITIDTSDLVGEAPPVSSYLWEADFMNDAYEVAGLPVAVGDMFGEDLGWGAFNDSTAIDATGLIGTPILLGDALAASVGGCTYVGEFYLANITDGLAIDLIDLPGYVGVSTVNLSAFNTDLFLGASSQAALDEPTIETVVKFAVTLTPTHIALSINGGAVTVIDGARGATANAIGLSAMATAPLRKLAALSTVTDAELPALSA